MDNAKALISEGWCDYAYIEVSVTGNNFKFTRVAEPIKASKQDNTLLVYANSPNIRGTFNGVSEQGVLMFPFEQIHYLILVPDEYYDPKPKADAADDPVEEVQPRLGWLITAKKKWEEFASNFKGWHDYD